MVIHFLAFVYKARLLLKWISDGALLNQGFQILGEVG